MLKLFNSLTRKKSLFKSLQEKTVTMYNCGPTVYDYAHIGNFRSYLVADLLRRYLEHNGYSVKQIMNITDVGHMTSDADEGQDKMEKAANREHKTVWDIAALYTTAFLEDAQTMKLKEPFKRPKATEHVTQMIALIQQLIKKKHAYVVNGSVYFSIPSFKKYGKLSGNTIAQLTAGASGRVGDNQEKRHALDFALWIRNPEHAMQWDSPWGHGYPGWHIECSAMAKEYLGETIDIHTGGVDNKFPHHECEIAQSEGASGKRFVRTWLHVAHLLVNGEKMSKSLGNFYTVRDVLHKGYSPEAMRYVLLSAHYRTHLNFTWESLDAATTSLASITDFAEKIADIQAKEYDEKLSAVTAKGTKALEKALDDDLNIAEAYKALFAVVKAGNKALDAGTVGIKNVQELQSFLKTFDSLFAFFPTTKKETLTAHQKQLIQEREDARKKHDFKKADQIRDELKKEGNFVEDASTGVRWKKA